LDRTHLAVQALHDHSVGRGRSPGAGDARLAVAGYLRR